MVDNAAQHTIGWYRARLGNITGSMVGVLMKEGRGYTFTDTAKTYLYQLAAERTMNPAIVDDDERFEDYIRQSDITTRAMRWGTEKEEEARDLYARVRRVNVVELGSCRHPSIPHFASSPDGFCYDEDSRVKTCLEIKCPVQSTFMRYVHEVHDNDTLLSVKPEYFYQCMAHMMVTGSTQTDFIAYCPWQRIPMHITRIMADESVFSKMENRIALANAFIDEVTNTKKIAIKERWKQTSPYKNISLN